MAEVAKGNDMVPESVLKNLTRAEEWALVKEKELEEAKKKKVETRRLICKKAKQYAEEYTKKERELIQLKREARLRTSEAVRFHRFLVSRGSNKPLVVCRSSVSEAN